MFEAEAALRDSEEAARVLNAQRESAACTSGSVQPSPVLLALGYPPTQAREAIRFSLGRSTTADEIERVLAILPGIVERARRHRG